MKQKNIVVESFTMDHTKVVAPFIRKCSVYNGKKGDIVTKFDLRFMQPNLEEIPTAAMHTIEHLLAGYMREKIQGIIDISPMGCRTGFYLIAWGNKTELEIKNALIYSLKKIISTKKVPATTAKECGNYRDHSLFSAIEYAKYVLNKLK